MKKYLCTAMVLWSFMMHAQVVGGGKAPTAVAQPEDSKEEKKDGKTKIKFFSIGYIMPTASASLPSVSDFYNQVGGNSNKDFGGMGLDKGVSMAIGTHSLYTLSKSVPLKLGYTLAVSLRYIHTNWQDFNFRNLDEPISVEEFGLYSTGLDIGPVFSYELSKVISLFVTYNITPSIVILPYFSASNTEGFVQLQPSGFEYDEIFAFKGFHQISVKAKFKNIGVGFNIDWGTLNEEYSYEYGNNSDFTRTSNTFDKEISTTSVGLALTFYY